MLVWPKVLFFVKEAANFMRLGRNVQKSGQVPKYGCSLVRLVVGKGLHNNMLILNEISISILQVRGPKESHTEH